MLIRSILRYPCYIYSTLQIHKCYASHKGAFKHYIIRLGGMGGLNQNDDTDDAVKGMGGLGLK